MAETVAAKETVAPGPPAPAKPKTTQDSVQQTGVTRRDYIPDAARMGGPLATEQLAAARTFLAGGNTRGARSEAKRVLKDAAAPTNAKWEAEDLLDRTSIDAGPLAAGVAMLIAIALMLMYYATLSGVTE